MIEAPAMSVIMPFRDTPSIFLREAVGSVVSQQDPRWELLLVDDGSADEATSVARRLAAEDPERIRYLHHEGHVNRGASASRNLGIEHARGEFISFLDSDDVWLPSKVGDQLALMNAHPHVGMLYGNTEYWHSWTGRREDAARDYFPTLGVAPDSIHEPPDLLIRWLRGEAAVPCTCSVVVRRQIAVRVGGCHDGFPRLYDDQVLYARVCLETPIYVSGRHWDRYRQRADSMCASARDGDEPKEARLAYLHWLAEALNERGAVDSRLRRALDEQLAEFVPTSMPRVARALRYLRRRGRKLRRRLAGWPS